MTDLGDRMKAYEAHEAGRRFIPRLPIYARIDGRNFSRFTRHMDRPYDEKMVVTMIETTRRLVEETEAIAGYTQSDEISLLWHRPEPKSQVFFDGKIFKIVSVVAAMTTSIFTELAVDCWPEAIGKYTLAFDCRAFQLPTREEAANVFLWRELDATKNAISMAARHWFSHKALQDKNGNQMQEMLHEERGIIFNDYPARFKRGTFVLKRKVLRELNTEKLADIPERHRPTGPVERQIINVVEMPQFSKVTNRVEVLFDGADPRVDS